MKFPFEIDTYHVWNDVIYIHNEILRNEVLWIVMVFFYFIVKKIKYAAEPQFWN